MYVVNMRTTRQYAQGEYVFNNKKDCRKFLENLNDYEIDSIIEINKLSRGKCDSAWYEFFED